MEVIKAPNSTEDVQNIKVFLAGTIDNGESMDWQSEIVKEFEDYDVTFLNPRRTKWNSKLKPILSNPKFREQVEWEAENLENADLIVMNMLEDSKSVISIAELGEYSSKGKFIVTCCPDNFYRQGNVEFICEKYGLPFYNKYEDMIKYLHTILTINKKRK